MNCWWRNAFCARGLVKISTSNLLSSSDWEHFDKAEADVLSEVMVLVVDMLGLRSDLWWTCQFECARVIFESLAVNLAWVENS
jgi:hypothetical protein